MRSLRTCVTPRRAATYTAILVHDECDARAWQDANYICAQTFVKGFESFRGVCTPDDVAYGCVGLILLLCDVDRCYAELFVLLCLGLERLQLCIKGSSHLHP